MVEAKDPSCLWHFCYSHLNLGGLKTPYQKNMVTGLLKIVIPFQVYEEFVAKKQHRFQFPKKEVIESKKMSWN